MQWLLLSVKIQKMISVWWFANRVTYHIDAERNPTGSIVGRTSNNEERSYYKMEVCGVNNGQKTIDIRPHTRYNIDNLIRKQCYHYRIFSENGSHKYEFAGTEWLNPQGDSVTHLSARGA